MEKSQNRKPFQALRDLFHPVDLTHGTGRRPTTGRGPRRQPPANTNGGEGPRAGAGQGRAAAIGAGAAGPGQYRPGLHPTGRIP